LSSDAQFRARVHRYSKAGDYNDVADEVTEAALGIEMFDIHPRTEEKIETMQKLATSFINKSLDLKRELNIDNQRRSKGKASAKVNINHIWNAFKLQVLEECPRGFIQVSILAARFEEIYNQYRADCVSKGRTPAPNGLDGSASNQNILKPFSRIGLNTTQYKMAITQKLIDEGSPDVLVAAKKRKIDAAGYVEYKFRDLPKDFVLQPDVN